jgi:hypothetical protein
VRRARPAQDHLIVDESDDVVGMVALLSIRELDAPALATRWVRLAEDADLKDEEVGVLRDTCGDVCDRNRG